MILSYLDFKHLQLHLLKIKKMFQKLCKYVWKHRWASTSVLMSAISDIDNCYSDIGDKYVGLKIVIPISEVFRYRHLGPFRYPTFKYKKFYTSWIRICASWNWRLALYHSATILLLNHRDVGYRIKLYSDVRYNIGLRPLSPISKIPISVQYCWSRISDQVPTYVRKEYIRC